MTENFKDPGIYIIEIYCDHTDCPAREAQLTVKLYNDYDVALLHEALLHCPVCHRKAKVHSVNYKFSGRAL